MKDFFAVFLMLVLVMAGILVFMFLGQVLGYFGMLIMEIVIVTAIILLAIRFIRPPR